MTFTRTMKLSELKGIISKYCLVAIREAGTHGKAENFRIPFSNALDKFGDYIVWFIDPLAEDLLGIVVSEEAP